MNAGRLLDSLGYLWSPLTFAALVALAVGLMWLALAPARPRREVKDRLDGYIERSDVIQEAEFSRPLASRTIIPALRSLLSFFGRLLPQRNAEQTRQMLEQAGRPFGLGVIDFYGLRVLLSLVLGGSYFLLAARNPNKLVVLVGVLALGAIGFLLPSFWLGGRARSRKSAILRAFPDALDMLTIGVEAGLAFESALVRVGEKWDNALCQEFRRAVGEMRIGVGRDEALQRMAARCGVEEIQSFIAVLVQSSTLGVSIAQVLHGQAAEVRAKRRMRAEELARQAGTKMIIPLVFLIFPAMFVVILGPAVSVLIDTFSTMGGGGP
jgi:tight adherence protein C